MQTQTSVLRPLSLIIFLLGVFLGLELQRPTTGQALAGDDLFLRRLGSEVLSTAGPTAATAKFIDSPPLRRTSYQVIGEWVAPPVTNSLRLTATTALQVWLGRRNKDNHGASFDLRAELRKNGVVIASGETRHIQGFSHSAHQAKKVTVPFGPIVNGRFAPGEVGFL